MFGPIITGTTGRLNAVASSTSLLVQLLVASENTAMTASLERRTSEIELDHASPLGTFEASKKSKSV